MQVQAEWSSLTRRHSRVENLRSATIVREWLEGADQRNGAVLPDPPRSFP
jgi:hypothetical protein